MAVSFCSLPFFLFSTFVKKIFPESYKVDKCHILAKNQCLVLQ